MGRDDPDGTPQTPTVGAKGIKLQESPSKTGEVLTSKSPAEVPARVYIGRVRAITRRWACPSLPLSILRFLFPFHEAFSSSRMLPFHTMLIPVHLVSEIQTVRWHQNLVASVLLFQFLPSDS